MTRWATSYRVDEALQRSLSEMEERGIGVVPEFFGQEVLQELLEELAGYTFQKQPDEIGTYRVKQRFSSVADFPAGSKFIGVQRFLEHLLNTRFSFCRLPPLKEPMCFNDLTVQRYEAWPFGISPHRDGKSTINLIAVLVLEGRGQFCLCDDREGNDPVPVRNEPGDLLLMRGFGFFCQDDGRPFHYVGEVTERRTTFALRHIKKAAS